MKTLPIFHLKQLRSSNKYVEAAKKRLPRFEGRSVSVRFLPELSAGRRKLYSKRKVGQPVYAATFVRKRKIVFDGELEHQPKELARILAHDWRMSCFTLRGRSWEIRRVDRMKHSCARNGSSTREVNWDGRLNPESRHCRENRRLPSGGPTSARVFAIAPPGFIQASGGTASSH